MEATILNGDEKKFLGYKISGPGLSIPFSDGYDDKAAIARAVNLAQGQGGIVLMKCYKTASGVVKEQIYPAKVDVPKRTVDIKKAHQRTIKW